MENLKNYGVQSLNAEEMREIDGGNWIKVAKYVKDDIVSASIWDGLKWTKCHFRFFLMTR